MQQFVRATSTRLHNIRPGSLFGRPLITTTHPLFSSTPSTDENIIVEHNSAEKSFRINFDDGEIGYLDYIVKGSGADSVIDFTHTGIPDSQRGKGYAQALVKAGLDWVVEKDYKFIPSCWYMRVYLRKTDDNPEYLSRRIEGKKYYIDHPDE